MRLKQVALQLDAQGRTSQPTTVQGALEIGADGVPNEKPLMGDVRGRLGQRADLGE